MKTFYIELSFGKDQSDHLTFAATSFGSAVAVVTAYLNGLGRGEILSVSTSRKRGVTYREMF